MEGTYMPSYHRAKIIKEVRNTHFQFGNDSNEYKTTSFADFKGKKGSVPYSKPTSNLSHIKISNDQKERFASEFNSKFRSTSEDPRQSPFKPAPAISLQTASGVYVTTSSNAFRKFDKIEQLPMLSRQTQNSMMKKMRKHNFDIGNKQSADLKTEEHKESYSDHQEIQVPTAKEIKNKYVKALEAISNPGPYVSTSFHDFKTFLPESPSKPIRVNEISSIKYPEKSIDFITTNNQKFSPKLAENNSLSPKRLSQLKSSHVALGQSPVNYSISSFQQSPVHSKLSIIKKQVSGSISLGGHSGDYSSNYSSNYLKRPQSTLESLDLTEKSQNISHVTLGVSKPVYSTESQAVHRRVTDSPNRLSPECEKMLKTDHFTLGQDPKVYSTISRDYGKGPASSSKPSHTSRTMNQSHWTLGNHARPSKSEVQKEFSWKGSPERQKPDKGKVNRCHFQVGDDKTSWKSNYNSEFSWIQPVPDTDYKIGLMN